ncbi:hypothetical protein BURKHO8Y_70072 [Burkholderia sp. 8Y]|nr:hypothetical protein BURKHO8Y_70072 [Burkholderia sp. 8Y]
MRKPYYLRSQATVAKIGLTIHFFCLSRRRPIGCNSGSPNVAISIAEDDTDRYDDDTQMKRKTLKQPESKR